MIKLEYRQSERKVYHEGIELRINEQRTKQNSDGSFGQPVINIEGLEGSNGTKWISLSKLKDGIHEYNLKPQIRTNSSSGKKPQFQEVSYILNDDEKFELSEIEKNIQGLLNRKNEIIQTSKDRFIPRPDISPETLITLTSKERDERLEEFKKYQSQFPKK